MLGNSGGGIVAVLMAEQGLFAPLWVGAGIMVIAAVVAHIYIIEPGDERLEVGMEDKLILADDDETQKRPDDIDKKTLYNIVGGAVSFFTFLVGELHIFVTRCSPSMTAFGQYRIDRPFPSLSLPSCTATILLRPSRGRK